MSLTENEVQVLKQFLDERGILLPVEFDDLPFTPQRMFMVTHNATFNPEKRVRGMHANKTCQQYFYCISGEVEVSLFDGVGKRKYRLQPGHGIFIDKMVWNSYLAKTMLGHIGIYIVLASHPYNAEDYITDREEFIKMISK